MAFLPHIVTATDGNDHSTDLISYDLVKNRIIYLNGEVNGDSAISIITQLRYLAQKSDKDIYLIPTFDIIGSIVAIVMVSCLI